MELKKPNILVVDDIPDNLQLLYELLAKQGYSVRPVLKGQQALNIAKSMSLQLILLDINMPEMNGYELCAHLKSNEKTKDVPIIFISAATSKMDKNKAYAAGGVDYITKPFCEREVLTRIKTHIKLYQQDAKLELIGKQAEQANRIQNQLLINLSHEIQMPMNTILNFSETLDKLIENPIQKKYVASIKNGIQSLLKTINSMPNLTKIESEKSI